MTVATTAAAISYAGNGSTTAFATGFVFFTTSDLTVQEIDADGEATLKALGTDYTVVGGAGASGTVTMAAAPASGVTLYIARSTPRTQDTSLTTAGAFPAKSVEQRLDRLTLLVQEIARQAGQALAVPGYESAPATLQPALSRANRFAKFDSTGALVPADLTTRAAVITAGWVDVLDYGAVGDGTTDDAPAFLAAIATGKPVYAPGNRTYSLQSSLTGWGQGQRLSGDGHTTILKPAGSFDVFVFTNTSTYGGNGVSDLYIDASGMASGYVFNLSGSARTRFENMQIFGAYNLLRAFKFNWLLMQNLWVGGMRGPEGIYAIGDDSNKSDILKVNNCAISGTIGGGLVPLTIDGNVHSVDLAWNHFVGVQNGILVTNTGGGTQNPQYIRCNGLSVDFATDDCVRLEAGRYFFFDCNTYMNGGYTTTGQTGSGFKVGSSVASGTVILDGGMIVGCGEYAIDGDASVNILGGDFYFANNVVGDLSSATVFRRSFGDTTFYMQMNGANPILNWASTDYEIFNRSIDTKSSVIGGTTQLQLLSTGLYHRTGVFGTISDERLKQDIEVAPSYWEDVKAIPLKKFALTADPTHQMLGFIAQDVQAVSPGMVDEDEDGFLRVKASIVLLKAYGVIQELQARVEALEASLE